MLIYVVQIPKELNRMPEVSNIVIFFKGSCCVSCWEIEIGDDVIFFVLNQIKYCDLNNVLFTTSEKVPTLQE